MGSDGLETKPVAVNFSVDVIRFIAIFAIILLHCTDFPYRFLNPEITGMDILGWFTEDAYNAIGMVGVPLFVMLTGALLLNPAKAEEPLSVFYKKRFHRIAIPIIFWSIVYLSWTFLVRQKPLTPFSLEQGLFNGSYAHFWYLYLLMGLYAVTPILRVLIKHLDRKLFTYLLALWFAGTVITPVLHLIPDLNFSPLPFIFIDWIGYFLLGFYMVNANFKRKTAYLMVILGFLVAVLGDWVIEATTGEQYAGFLHGYLSFNIIIGVAALFFILMSIPPTRIESHHKTNRFIRWVSENTLPIYLIHIIFLETFSFGYLGFYLNKLTWIPLIDIPAYALITFGFSAGTVFLLKKIPYVKKIIG